MSDNSLLAAVLAAAEPESAPVAAVNPAPVAAAPEPAPAAPVAAAPAVDPVASAVVGERARIKGILTAEAAQGRAGLAAHLAFETAMAADEATAILAAAPVAAAPVAPAAEAGTPLDRAMSRAAITPATGAPAPTREAARAPVVVDMASIYADRAKQQGGRG